jgi:DNA modification methylase
VRVERDNIYLGDCLDLLQHIDSESVDLVFADPPFNIGYVYNSYKDNKPYEEYNEWSNKWIKECARVLKPNGSMYVAIGDEYSAEINIILKKSGMNFRNWIVWYYTFGQNCRKKFSRTHTHIHYFTKNSKDFTFNVDDIRVPSARQLKYNDKRANSKGKVPDDTWQMSRVCGTFKERVKSHPCQMPEEVLERIIKASTNPGDLVLDPFCGSGTTCAVAKRLDRHYISFELDKVYFEESLERLRNIGVAA